MINEVRRRGILAGLLVAGTNRAVYAGDWPDRPVSWVVPFPSGGETDVFARPVAEKVAGSFRQPILVDNRGGFGGALGANLVAIAPADGYTMLIGNTGLCFAPQVYSQAGFDLGRSFDPVSALARVPFALVINPAIVDASSLQEYIVAVKQRPRTINIGSSGVGTVSHLAIDLFESRAGVNFRHMASRGTAAAMRDLLAGEVSALFAPVGSVLEYAKVNKLRTIAITSRRREPLLPDVPTFAEAGLANFRISSWYGVFAPRGTPSPILDRVHGAVQAALGNAEIKRLWLEAGAKVEVESRAEFARFVDMEIRIWGQIAKSANIQLQ